jgi:beta-phosphoglucomutase-like phosphatase (HAD superfamily)
MIIDIKTILFDFDGVIIDSEPLHAKAKKLVLEEFGIP